jgi:hypothetical protein
MTSLGNDKSLTGEPKSSRDGLRAFPNPILSIRLRPPCGGLLLSVGPFRWSDDFDHDDFARSELLTQLSNQGGPALSESVELGVEAADEAASSTIKRKRLVFFAANIELELGTVHCL